MRAHRRSPSSSSSTAAAASRSGGHRREVHERRLPPRSPGEIVKAMVRPRRARRKLSRAELDKLEEFVKGMGAKGLARAKVDEDGEWTQSPLAKTITPELRAGHQRRRAAPRRATCSSSSSASESLVHTVMANLRVHLAKKLGLIPESARRRVELPLGREPAALRVRRGRRRRWAAAHHAFTRPHDECVELLENDPGKVHCYRYDLVLNGFEIGGGSIRLHDPEVQAEVFTRARHRRRGRARRSSASCSTRSSFGAPPHGGIALGMDRLAMLLTGRREPARRHPLPEDAEGHRSDDRRAGRGGRAPAARAARALHAAAPEVDSQARATPMPVGEQGR